MPAPSPSYRFGRSVYHDVSQVLSSEVEYLVKNLGHAVYVIESPTGVRYFIGNLPTLKVLANDMSGQLSRVFNTQARKGRDARP